MYRFFMKFKQSCKSGCKFPSFFSIKIKLFLMLFFRALIFKELQKAFFLKLFREEGLKGQKGH